MDLTQISNHELATELRRRFDAYDQSILEMQKLNSDLKILNKRLEESEKLKSHFISNITNEIINPFASILGLSKAILSVDKENWKKVISMIALIHSEAFNLDFQFKNIFVAAKLEAGEAYPEIMNVNLGSMFENLVDTFRIECRKKQLEIRFVNDLPTPPTGTYYFRTDPEKVKIIVANLFSNAVKFSYHKQAIDLRVWLEDTNLKVLVRDYGTGISPENQKIIFDRFKRLDSGINSINRGHGLGLSVNKALMDILKGTIHLESAVDKGASFTVTLPEWEGETEGLTYDGNEFIFNDDEVF